MARKRGKALLAARTMAAESAEKDNREKAVVSRSSRPGLQSLAAWPLYASVVGGGLPSVRSPLFLHAGDSSSISQISSARLPERPRLARIVPSEFCHLRFAGCPHQQVVNLQLLLLLLKVLFYLKLEEKHRALEEEKIHLEAKLKTKL
ncbi:hypothetical protein GUJ93_ZPchr0009g2484 [Zizania palustris]|uniref:Uncharacterized protein n=1 Tax=Zizania palustris TaxID=103762 RepID=A0A8J5RR88_ZIZPA|nr:hypothetical protein GUJ93_ZPchr0009g2484 [Zizania palustris]